MGVGPATGSYSDGPDMLARLKHSYLWLLILQLLFSSYSFNQSCAGRYVRYRIASRQALKDPWDLSSVGAQILEMSQAVQIFNAEETRAKRSQGLRCREDSTTLASPHEFRCVGDSR
ncbi:hypothetical protein PAL_GLEAN10024363 [Pteropus alecto]|uniref:Uncharacterized protein n=1 Tax=Pteropus alecto TaxID=9402 RepID=L5K0C5_PTEAL|nr:hypothetical protein PAL_GLEAN10024363 [Pteropus alecto]